MSPPIGFEMRQDSLAQNAFLILAKATSELEKIAEVLVAVMVVVVVVMTMEKKRIGLSIVMVVVEADNDGDGDGDHVSIPA